MGNLVIKEPPEFQDKIHKIEEEEYLTAELENGIKGALLNNDVYLKWKLEEIIENIESGGVGVTFPLDVPNSKEIKFIGIQVPNNHFASEILDHILYKYKNALVLKTVDEKNKEKELIRVYEDDFGNSVICFEPYWIDMASTSLKVSNMSLVDTNEDEITVRAVATDNGSGLEICKDGSVYETLLEIDGDGISHFSHSIAVKSGNLNINNSNAQIVNFKNYKITQNGNDDFFVISQSNNIGAFIQFSNSQNQINLHKNINSLHEFFAHELIKCYVNKGIHFAQAGTVYHVYQKGQSGELLFDVVNLLNGSRTNVIDCNLDGTVTFAKKIKISSEEPNYAASMEIKNAKLILKGGSDEGGIYGLIRFDLDTGTSFVGTLEAAEVSINGILMAGVEFYNAFNIKYRGVGIETIFLQHHIFGSSSTSGGIYFADPQHTRNIPYYSIKQEQATSDKNNQHLKIECYSADLTSVTVIADITKEEVRFGVPVTASNITKMASDIVTAQQEITEQDLQLIETQQMLTDQELENIETQQMLTEMDLEKIEGGQAV